MSKPTLDDLGRQFGTDKSTTSHCYTLVYERWLAPLRDEPIVLLEIGVAGGKSLRMWDTWFRHPKARIFGMDVALTDEAKAGAYTSRVELVRGDQGRGDDLNGMARRLADAGGPDVIVDDGGHMASAQQRSFRRLWPILRPGGQYWIEDLEACYRPRNNDARQSTVDMLRGLQDLSLETPDVASVRFWMQLCLVVKGGR